MVSACAWEAAQTSIGLASPEFPGRAAAVKVAYRRRLLQVIFRRHRDVYSANASATRIATTRRAASHAASTATAVRNRKPAP